MVKSALLCLCLSLGMLSLASAEMPLSLTRDHGPVCSAIEICGIVDAAQLEGIRRCKARIGSQVIADVRTCMDIDIFDDGARARVYISLLINPNDGRFIFPSPGAFPVTLYSEAVDVAAPFFTGTYEVTAEISPLISAGEKRPGAIEFVWEGKLADGPLSSQTEKTDTDELGAAVYRLHDALLLFRDWHKKNLVTGTDEGQKEQCDALQTVYQKHRSQLAFLGKMAYRVDYTVARMLAMNSRVDEAREITSSVLRQPCVPLRKQFEEMRHAYEKKNR